MSVLRNETIIVKYINNLNNGITDKKHPLYGGLSTRAAIAVVPPLLKGEMNNVLTPEEKKELENILKVNLDPSSDFWKEVRVDVHGVNLSKFPIFLKKEGMLLKLSDPMDYIYYKVLLASNIVAENKASVKYKPQEYRFYMVNKEKLYEEDIQDMNFEKEAITLHSKYEKDVDVLTHILKSFGKNPGPSHNLDFLQKESWRQLKLDPKSFINIAKDKYLKEKVLIDQAVFYDLVDVQNKGYFFKDGEKLQLDKGTNDYEGAAMFLASGAGQDRKLALEALVKKAKQNSKL